MQQIILIQSYNKNKNFTTQRKYKFQEDFLIKSLVGRGIQRTGK
jgi:hypothetical protein